MKSFYEIVVQRGLKFYESIKYAFDEFVAKLNREKIISVVLAVTLTFLAYLDSNFFGHKLMLLGWIFIIVMFFLIIYGFMLVAGIAVIKSLFLLSAEISLLIFIAQSYCSVESIERTLSSDNALNVLITLSVVYIIYFFIKSLSKAIDSYYEDLKDEKSKPFKIFVIITFSISICYFLWIISQVTAPIFLDLCIYTP